MVGPVASMIVGAKQKHRVEKWTEMVGLAMPEHPGRIGVKHQEEGGHEMVGPIPVLVHPGKIIGMKHEQEGSRGETWTLIKLGATGVPKGMIGETAHPPMR
jgi:hypothetical protein